MWNRSSEGKPYCAGDIVGVVNTGLMGQLAWLAFKPQTRLFHFLVIRSYLEEEDDYEIIEMLGGFFPWEPSGCRTGRLSWYRDRTYCVFRLNDPYALMLGKRAAKYASKFGRIQYDFGLFFKLPADCFRCWFWQIVKEHRLRRIRPNELKLVWDSIFVCTELPLAIWAEVKRYFIDGAGIPAAYAQAWLDERLLLMGGNDGGEL
jgi:hypothetical protein